jgi:ABC-2 type transport system ATP-binding protein
MLAAMSAPAIEAAGLKKNYGPVEALRGVDLRVDRGEIFALLGPNGAGKTTLVEILEGHRSRSAGEVRVLGHDPARRELALRRRVGMVLQETGVEPYLTVEETIELFRGYYPHPLTVDEVVEVVGLQDKGRSRVKRLSGGERRRLDVAVGLAGDPELLFLDEPTTGFDPSARRRAWDMVENLKVLGKTVLLTTHYMDEAQHLADRVAIIVRGKIVAQGAPDILTGGDGRTRIRFELSEGRALPVSLSRRARLEGKEITITSDDATTDLHALTGWAIEAGAALENLTVTGASLEEFFLEITSATDAPEAVE